MNALEAPTTVTGQMPTALIPLEASSALAVRASVEMVSYVQVGMGYFYHMVMTSS